jgi:hypothetical protein
LALFGVVSTEPVRHLGPSARWFYKRLTHKEWADVVDPPTFDDVWFTLDEMGKARVERIIMLKQLGTAGGPCCLVAGILVGLRYRALGQEFDAWVAATGFLVGLVFLGLGQITAAQQAQFYRTADARMTRAGGAA